MKRAFNQQPKPDPTPEAVTSLVLGIISLVLNLSIVIYYLQWEVEVLPYNYSRITALFFIADLSFIWGWLIPILGLALGIMGLRAMKHKLAKLALAGSILSFADLVIYACMVYIFELTWYVVILPFKGL
ncbi:hypothetical protein ACFLTN_02805 [Chloroflexota bacterium]